MERALAHRTSPKKREQGRQPLLRSGRRVFTRAQTSRADSRMLPRIAVTTCDEETDMDSTKKVVEPPKGATPPVKAQPQPQHDAAKASAEQPKPKT